MDDDDDGREEKVGRHFMRWLVLVLVFVFVFIFVPTRTRFDVKVRVMGVKI
jgi:hypothetical protein